MHACPKKGISHCSHQPWLVSFSPLIRMHGDRLKHPRWKEIYKSPDESMVRLERRFHHVKMEMVVMDYDKERTLGSVMLPLHDHDIIKASFKGLGGLGWGLRLDGLLPEERMALTSCHLTIRLHDDLRGHVTTLYDKKMIADYDKEEGWGGETEQQAEKEREQQEDEEGRERDEKDEAFLVEFIAVEGDHIISGKIPFGSYQMYSEVYLSLGACIMIEPCSIQQDPWFLVRFDVLGRGPMHLVHGLVTIADKAVAQVGDTGGPLMERTFVFFISSQGVFAVLNIAGLDGFGILPLFRGGKA